MCEDYPKSQVSREDFVRHPASYWLVVDELPEEGFIPRLADSYWSKRAAIMVCQDEMTKDLLAAKVSTLLPLEGSRLKVVGFDALPTFKRTGNVVFVTVPKVEPGLDTGQWSVYERRDEPNGVRLCSVSMQLLSPY